MAREDRKQDPNFIDDGSIFGRTVENEREWKFDNRHSYLYRSLGDNEDDLEVRVQFRIHRSRLRILEKICEMKSFMGHLDQYVQQTLMEQIERDLRSPETIAKTWCESALKGWNGYPARHEIRLRDEIDR